MDGTILIADDDRTIRTVLTQAFSRAGCKVRATGSASTLWRWVEEGEGDVVVSDVMMPDGDGIDLLPSIRRRRPDLPVIVISAQNTVLTAVRATESGAYDYLPKPFDLKDLLLKVSKALSPLRVVKPAGGDAVQGQPLPLVGSSPAMQGVYRILARVLNTDLHVMISGESGTGKNLLARTLHGLGHRRDQPFLEISAAAATPDVLESLLLRNGGPTTGASGTAGETSVAAQNEASTGPATVHLDEVGDMSADTQQHLLALLREPRIRDRNFRFVSSTREPVDSLVDRGLFREDLFYRLNVIPISLPPLRERLDDLPALVSHFMRISGQPDAASKTVSKEGMECMRSMAWPGNVRELENFIQQLTLLCPDDEVGGDFIAETLRQSSPGGAGAGVGAGSSLSSVVEAQIRRQFELHGSALPPRGLYNRIIRQVELPLLALSLSATRGNQVRAAALLGINRNTLRKKIRDLNIEVTRTRKLM